MSAHADRSEQKVWQPERRGNGHQVTCLVQDSGLGSLLDQAHVCANQVRIHFALHLHKPFCMHLVLPALDLLPTVLRIMSFVHSGRWSREWTTPAILMTTLLCPPCDMRRPCLQRRNSSLLTSEDAVLQSCLLCCTTRHNTCALLECTPSCLLHGMHTFLLVTWSK